MAGELGIASDTLRVKTGDGVHTWPNLSYMDADILSQITAINSNITTINSRLDAIESNLANLNTLAQSQLTYLNAWSGQLEEEEAY